MTNPQPAQILEAIAARYGSLEDPDYSFVSQIAAEQPYAHVLEALASLVTVEETTDVNDDVSFRYVLSGQRRWTLSLSMVGRFGLLMALESDPRVVTDVRAEGTEREIVRLLDRADIALLPRAILETTIPFRRPGDEGASATIYHALISDEPLLPWDSPS